MPDAPRVQKRFDPREVSDLVMSPSFGASESSGAETNRLAGSRVSFLMSTGLEYADGGEYEEAERAYLRALEQDPANDDLLFRLSTLYVMMERYADAIAILERQLEKYPENGMLHNNLAWCYATSPMDRNTVKALRHAREGIMSTPDNPSMWNTLAEAYYVAADYERALRSADCAIDLLAAVGDADAEKESFEAQRDKILRARDAYLFLEGLDGE